MIEIPFDFKSKEFDTMNIKYESLGKYHHNVYLMVE
jgi:hypothetical protein